MGGGMGNSDSASTDTDQATTMINMPIDTPVSQTTLEDRPMLGELLSNDTYLEEYHTYFDEFLSSYMESGECQQLIESTKELIAPYVKKDPSAFFTYDEFETAVDSLQSFCELRTESIRGQLDGSIPSTEDGQSQDSSSLIDASDLDLTSMGSMNNGNTAEKMDDSSKTQNSVNGTQNESGKTQNNFNGKPRDFNGKQDASVPSGAAVNMPFSNGTSADTAETTKQSVVVALTLTGGCFLLLIAGLLFAKRYRRKKR